jgi:hypothetical protein
MKKMKEMQAQRRGAGPRRRGDDARYGKAEMSLRNPYPFIVSAFFAAGLCVSALAFFSRFFLAVDEYR